MNTIFENENFIAVEKQPGWLTVPSRFPEKDPRPCLGTELARQAESQKVWPVHRLDAEVSGVVLFAKNAQAHRQSNLWFQERKVHKLYEAWTEQGKIPQDWKTGQQLEWSCLLLRGKRRAYESPHGKRSVTKATWKGSEKRGEEMIQKWELEPLTGRSHQLRYELYRHGFPILGDSLYGSQMPFPNNAHAGEARTRQGIALRSVHLDFSDCHGFAEFGLPERIAVKGLAEVFNEY